MSQHTPVSTAEELRIQIATGLDSVAAQNTMRRAANEIERLQKIEAAARNLIAVKGRYHTEIAYKRLEEGLK